MNKGEVIIRKDVLSNIEDLEEGSSLWSDALARLKKNKAAIIGLGIVIAIGIISLITPWIAPYAYEVQDLDLGSVAPNSQHWLGTDVFGRDMLTRIMWGGRVSLSVGIIATAVSLVIGVLWGSIAGFFGGRIDSIMMRIVDTLYPFPFMVLVILLSVIFGRHIYLMYLAIGAVEWLTMARVIRGQVLTVRKQEFIEACFSQGISTWRIITRHVIPNVLGPVIVYTTLTIPSVMILEAFLSFLGLGVQPPMCSWGSLIGDGAKYMEEYSWLLIYPGAIFSITLFSLNFLGDGLRDALDPKASKD